MYRIYVFLIIFSLIYFSCNQGKNEDNPTPDNSSDKTIQNIPDTFKTIRINSRALLRNAEIIISKSERTLSVYESSDLIGYYKIALGKNPVSDKNRNGDFSTPEGNFYICHKNLKSKFHLSLLISYPNTEDAERGLKDSIISKEEYNNIVFAINHKKTPPQNTALGGDICIHGGGTVSDWTFGCIALENEHIEEMFRVINNGINVIIKK